MRVSRKALGLTAAIAAVAALGFVVLSGDGRHHANAAGPSEQAQQAGLPVPVVAVVKKAVPVYLDYVATAEAIRSVTLQAKVGGYLAARGAADGADVKEGDLLYRIDPRDYQAALDQVKAQAQHDAAAQDYSRASQHRNAVLSKSGWVTQDTNDQSTSTLHQADATLAGDQAAIEMAQLNLSYTEIRAPFAGRLSRSAVHEGALITAAGTALNTLVQLDPIYATFNPSERDLARIEKYRAAGPIPVEVQIADSDATKLEGTLTFIDNAVDRNTGTIVARATIANADRSLLPGQYVHVRLRLTDRPDALLVPQTALGSSQLGKFVYVVGEGNRAEQRFVSPGDSYGDLIVIDSGLKEGETVITGNLQKLGPDTPVQPQPADEHAS